MILRLLPPPMETLDSKGVSSLRFLEVELILIQQFGLWALPFHPYLPPFPSSDKAIDYSERSRQGETSAPVL